MLRTPGESGALQAAIQRVSDDQDPGPEEKEPTDKERELWVLPQRGIISLWSSKATVIFGLCGLGDIVQRVERGVVYCITFANNSEILRFRLSEHKQINNTESEYMVEPCTNRVRQRH
ncbi:phosphoribosylformylglycinamidine synthase [Coemansia sp. RSA 2706]